VDYATNTPITPRPNATLFESGHRWMINLGEPAESYLPPGVSWAGSGDFHAKSGPDVHRMVDRLLRIPGGRDDGVSRQVAQRALTFVKYFGSLDLCEKHGKPGWHSDRALALRGTGKPCAAGDEISVDDLVIFVQRAQTLLEMATAGAGRGAPNREVTKYVEGLAESNPLGLFPSTKPFVWFAGNAQSMAGSTRAGQIKSSKSSDWESLLVIAEWAVSGKRREAEELSISELSRALTEWAANDLLEASKVTPVVLWHKGRGIDIDLVANSVVGLYVLDLVGRLGRSETRTLYKCQNCGLSYDRKRPPKEGEGVFCRRPECQRERFRVNAEKHRLRIADEGSDV
jgi:hypothetical protein